MKISIGKVIREIVREELFSKIAVHKMLTEEQSEETINGIAKRIIMNKMLLEYMFDKRNNREEIIKSVTLVLEPLLQLVHTTDRRKIEKEINVSLQKHMPKNKTEAISLVNHCKKCGEQISGKEEICFVCIAAQGTEFRRGYILNTNVNTIEQDKRLIRAFVLGGERIDISDIKYDKCNMPILTQLRENEY